MIKYEIFVPIYEWKIIILHSINVDQDKRSLLDIFSPFGATEEYLQDTFDRIQNGSNNAETYWDPKKRVQIIMFGNTFTPKKVWENTHHEFRHLIDAIVKTHEITDMEAPAYLDGWFWGHLYDIGFCKEVFGNTL